MIHDCEMCIHQKVCGIMTTRNDPCEHYRDEATAWLVDVSTNYSGICVCSHCGNPMRYHASRYCPHCGRKLEYIHKTKENL